DSEPPVLAIKITTPQPGDSFKAGSDIEIVASTGKDAPPLVVFYANGQTIGKGTPLPTFAPGGIYQLIWKAVPAGKYALVAAVVTEDGKVVAKSDAVEIVVEGGGPPTLTIKI